MTRTILSIFLLLNFIVAFSQQQFTFKDALQKAEANNPDLKIESFKLGYSDADITTAGLRPNPIFNNQFLQLMESANKAPGSSLLGGQNRQVWYQLTKPMQLSNIRQKKIDLAQQGKSVSQLEIQESKRNIYYESGTRLGNAEYKLGNLVSCLEAYEEACLLDPFNMEVWQNWSYVLYENGDVDKAIVLIMSGIEEIPNNAELYYRATVYLLNAGRYKEAYSHLENALTLDYDKHTVLFDFFPKLQTQKALLKIIDQYKK